MDGGVVGAVTVVVVVFLADAREQEHFVASLPFDDAEFDGLLS